MPIYIIERILTDEKLRENVSEVVGTTSRIKARKIHENMVEMAKTNKDRWETPYSIEIAPKGLEELSYRIRKIQRV